MQALSILENKIKNKENILMMFDYDGTLTPNVKRPETAVLDERNKLIIENFAQNFFLKVAIITGRDADAFLKVSNLNMENIYFYGIHGGQTIRNGKIIDFLEVEDQLLIKEFFQILQKEFADNDNLILENKISSIALHYRLCSMEEGKEAKKFFIDTVNNLKLLDKFKLQKGKKLIEILPKSFSKGNAVKTIIEETKGYYPCYFGDDIADISAFKVVKEHNGLAFGVGNIHEDITTYIDETISNDRLFDILKIVG